MNDFDLEELESHLYSQVYHGLNDETDENNSELYSGVNSLSKPTDDMRKSGRYFGPWIPGSRFQTRNVPKQTNFKGNRDSCKSDGYYTKNYSKQSQPDVSIEQVVVVSPNRPIVFMNSRERSKAKWKAKLKEKRWRQRVKRQRARENKRKESEVVITLSDSDDNEKSCVIIEKKWPLLTVDSDDESKISTEEKSEKTDNSLSLKSEQSDSGNAHLSDDVIFVEPEVIPPVIINIDEESEILEKASSTSSDTISVSTTPRKETTTQKLHKERRELLSTPDSASNDFISNSGVELNQGNFNFGLHGSDFHSGEFLKPAPKTNETCETESSSSTTDINSVNLMKTVVFNEIDFPKDIFSEKNLESFGNFITPFRKLATVTNAQSSPVKPVENQHKNVYTSDSSSESDLEESQLDASQTKCLPELSPMVANQDINRDTPQVPKKIKKLTTFSSKYDLLDSVISESSGKDIKQKSSKKKKTKKKPQNSTNNEEDVERAIRDDSKETSVETDAIGIENISEEPKRKKKKLNQIEGENLENPLKKKCNSSNINKIYDEEKSIVKTSEDRVKISKQNDNFVEQSVSISQIQQNSSELDLRKSNTNLEDFNLDKVKVEPLEVDTVNNAATSSENVDYTKNKIDLVANVKKNSDSQLDDLVIIDETFNDSTLEVSSDSESVLSVLNETSDIQFNINELNKDRISPVNPFNDCENFSVKSLQEKMSNDPNLWRILETDRYPTIRNKGRRCNRCKQWGHMAIRCPNKVEIKCSLCGAKGHFEPRCPNKVCTQCGKPSPYSTTYCNSCFKLRNYQCSICSMTGHLPDSCPDLWRRYHLTTEEGPLVTFPGPSLKQVDKLWCSGCAQSGHLEHYCNFYKSVYPPSDPSIKSYEEVYYRSTTQHDNRITQFRKPQQVSSISPQLYYEGDYSNFDHQYYHGFDQSGRNINENSFRPMKSNLNPFIGEVFIKNQQNYYPPVAQNVIQFPETSYSMNLSPYSFENALPNYISFESNPPQSSTNFRDLPNSNMRLLRDAIRSPHTLPKRNAIFFSSTAIQLQHFINNELHRLGKLSLLANKLVKEFKRRQIPARRHVIEREDYYETLNMLLFGVMNMIDGKMHLERLKKFKRDKLKHKVSAEFRRILHKSYCYIFGRDKHIGVHYAELLRKI